MTDVPLSCQPRPWSEAFDLQVTKLPLQVGTRSHQAADSEIAEKQTENLQVETEAGGMIHDGRITVETNTRPAATVAAKCLVDATTQGRITHSHLERPGYLDATRHGRTSEERFV